MFVVSTSIISCCGCFLPPPGGTLTVVPSSNFKRACCTPSPEPEPTEDVDDLKKRHEVELEEFREKLSKAEQELQEQLEYQEQKPDKLTINIDESVNLKSDDEVKKKKD